MEKKAVELDITQIREISEAFTNLQAATRSLVGEYKASLKYLEDTSKTTLKEDDGAYLAYLEDMVAESFDWLNRALREVGISEDDLPDNSLVDCYGCGAILARNFLIRAVLYYVSGDFLFADCHASYFLNRDREDIEECLDHVRSLYGASEAETLDRIIDTYNYNSVLAALGNWKRA